MQGSLNSFKISVWFQIIALFSIVSHFFVREDACYFKHAKINNELKPNGAKIRRVNKKYLMNFSVTVAL